MSVRAKEIQRRRTFAIISHPDAGKTTLTEKLLLYGGAIQLAGAVKARGEQRRAHSDWMKVERERGISVTASVMSFEYGGCAFNLLDTPGHEDFSEDTYRTLTAVDAAVMVLDSAKGIESQTRKLFEVCRMRDIPIVTFVNKLDREGRDPLSLLDEVADELQLFVTPASWPIGMGRQFKGCYDLFADELHLLERGEKGRVRDRGEVCRGLDDPQLDRLLSGSEATKLREDVEMVRELCPAFDLGTFRGGDLTPVYFGSAINDFGVRSLLDGLVSLAPPPRGQQAEERFVAPEEDPVSGFVFKIQANMDPNYRDRIAFVRLVSGSFERGQKLLHVRTGKTVAVRSPVMFLARERELAEEAWPGDILGFPNRGDLHIGDTFTEGEVLHFTGIPSFAPEYLKKIRPIDPMRAKHLGKALVQLAEEGAAQSFRPRFGNEWIVGVAGPLQFEVLADRIRTEYELEVRFEPTRAVTARWVDADDHRELKKFLDGHEYDVAEDHAGNPVFLPTSTYRLQRAEELHSAVRFQRTRERAAS